MLHFQEIAAAAPATMQCIRCAAAAIRSAHVRDFKPASRAHLQAL